MTKDIDWQAWNGDFDLRGMGRNGERPDPDKIARVDVLRMNPIFAHRCRELILAGMTEVQAKVLLYEVSPKQTPPDLINYFQQIPGRHKRLATEKFENFALLGITKNLAFGDREMINSQIVVVGPSECGLSAIERLLLDKDLYFTSITLLVPEGVTVGGVGNTLTGRNLVKLGLECRITLLAAEVVSLDRESRIVGLSNGEDVNYDYLVLTAGLQDQTRCHLQRTAESKFSSVVTIQELLADSSKGLPERRQNIIVYGSEIDAYHALSLLEARGTPRERVRHVIPEGVVSPMAECLKSAAGMLNLGLPDTATMTLVEVEEAEENKLICSFEVRNIQVAVRDSVRCPALTTSFAQVRDEITEEFKNVDEQCDVLVACDTGDINPSLFQCINESSLVYDGRLVVDQDFQTNDPRIYGGGSMAKFSRSVHPCLKMETCNSREVGQKLGESLVRHFKLQSLNVHDPPAELGPPDFSMSKAVGCTLPGAAFFVFAGTKEAMAKPSIEAVEGGRCLSTKTADAFFQLNLDSSMVVCSAIYCGRMRVSAPRLSCIVGLPSAYLNGIVEKYDNKDISDLMLFLHGGWAEALYHDRFSELRASLLKRTSESKQNESDSEPDAWLQSHVREEVESFIKANLHELPAYTITA
ncbi:hypothetical protein BSKO_01398 [Bryopsis sp. KO-2023]|nr:hypothetical protein BSKO_01398 [Bryopsis sp. KO-2023]